MKNEIEEKLAYLLSLFNDRPNHLAKYLIDNGAFNQTFLKKVLKSGKLDINVAFDEIEFSEFGELKEYYNNLLSDNDEQEGKNFNETLRAYIDGEEYEKAASIKNYMIKNKIKIVI